MTRAPRIPGFQILTLDAPGPIGAEEGTNEGWWGTGRVYVKSNSDEHPFVVANEFLCARLAAALGIPVPAGEVARDTEDRLAWASTMIELDGDVPAPEDVSDIVLREPDLAAGIFVFDVWVLNIDRYDFNLLSHPKLGLWVIDHDQALNGSSTGVAGKLEGCSQRIMGTHILREQPLAEDRLHAWGARIQALPKSAIHRLVAEGAKRGLYVRVAVDEIANFLLHRQADIHRLVRQSLPTPLVGAGVAESDEGDGTS